MHRAALDRPGPHERDLHGQVVERSPGGVRFEHLHLRARLDLEDAHRLRRLDLPVDRGDRRTGSAKVDPLPRARAIFVHASLDRRRRPTTTGRSTKAQRPRVPSPTGPSAALHRGPLDRRSRRRLVEITIPPGARSRGAGPESCSRRISARQRGTTARGAPIASAGGRDLVGRPTVTERAAARPRRAEAERLAEVADHGRVTGTANATHERRTSRPYARTPRISISRMRAESRGRSPAARSAPR